jgi:hypothetical protein
MVLASDDWWASLNGSVLVGKTGLMALWRRRRRAGERNGVARI